MSKCENCVKSDVCFHKANIKNDTYAYMGVTYDTENCPHYKDKSLCVELPVRVGDLVWKVCAKGSEYTKIEREVHSLKVDLIYINNDIIIHCVNENSSAHMMLSDFGKTVFLAKEEAERKLEEMGV